MSHKRRRGSGQGSLFKRQGEGSWIATWYDHEGKRRERSTRTTDKAAAERILAKLVADAALRRDGVIDAKTDQYAAAAKRTIATHAAAYVQNLQNAGRAPRRISQVRSHLEKFFTACSIKRLSDLTSDGLSAYMASLRASGKAPATVNHVREAVVAFGNWSKQTGLLESNPVAYVPRLDTSVDRRRIRRALTDDELGRLIAVARKGGRDAWYLGAVLAGLRKGDLQQLKWADVNFSEMTITVRGGKAKRVDVIPMHRQLADALQQRLERQPALGQARVFPTTVTDRTRHKDFLKAGLAREEVVRDAQGDPIMVGSGQRRQPKVRITTTDEDGRVVDLHALRTTLGTQLARSGVAPQVAQRMMRHADFRTTNQHYTVLGLADTASAVDALPTIQTDQERAVRATGTTDRLLADEGGNHPQLIPQQLGRDTLRNSALRGVGSAHADDSETAPKPTKNGPYGPLNAKRVRRFERPTFTLAT